MIVLMCPECSTRMGFRRNFYTCPKCHFHLYIGNRGALRPANANSHINRVRHGDSDADDTQRAYPVEGIDQP